MTDQTIAVVFAAVVGLLCVAFLVDSVVSGDASIPLWHHVGFTLFFGSCLVGMFYPVVGVLVALLRWLF